MAAITTFSGKTETLRKYVDLLERSGKQYFDLNVSINDETDEYGNNVKVTVSQSKEEREAKKKKSYVGNGRVIWSDGTVKVAEKQKPKDELKTEGEKRFDEHSDISSSDGLPF